MTKIKELLDKFNVDLKLDDKILNYEGILENLGLNLDYFTGYHDESLPDGGKIHVFEGIINSTFEGITDSLNFEFIINPKDEEHDGNPSATYLVMEDSGVAGAYYKEIFDDDIIFTEQM